MLKRHTKLKQGNCQLKSSDRALQCAKKLLKRIGEGLAKGQDLKRSGIGPTASIGDCKSKGMKKGKRIASRPKSQAQLQEDKEDQQRMWELFERHWLIKTKQGGKHYCESCGDPIYGENKSLYHHHCWPKSSYPEHQYKIEGLMLVCWQCHSNIENAFISEETQNKIEEIIINP